jgi:hypothetical protein
MKVGEVPQDDSILEGHQRACYAQDQDGRYVIATSRGWEVERIANGVVIAEIDAKIAAARAEVLAGRVSVLAYHMARCHMDVSLLAAHTGLWSFRIRRHLRPEVFTRLDSALLRRYAEAFDIEPEALRRLPD